MLAKMDRGWYDRSSVDCWTQAGVRCTVDFGQSKGGAECSFPEVPVAKRTILQKDALALKFSVWRVLSARGLGTVNILPEGEGEGRVLPCCLKATIRADFGCLTVNYGHI